MKTLGLLLLLAAAPAAAAPISCPGSQPLTSTKEATCRGIRTGANSICAKNEAETAVNNDLVAQVNAATCASPCFKSGGNPITYNPPTVVRCERKWYTLWIMVVCKATATGNVTVECKVEG